MEDHVLELASLVLGAEDAPVHDVGVAQAYVLGPTVVYSRAGEATVGMLRQDHVHDVVADLVHFRALSGDHHAIRSRGCAGGGGAPHVLDLHHAHSTGAKGLEGGVPAEIGDVDPGLPGGLYDRLVLTRLYLLPIDGECDLIHG